MIVIADTTPVISLLKIERLNLLQQLFGEVFIPDAVYVELTSDKRFANEAYAVAGVSYMKSVSVSNPGAVRILRMAEGLDQGKAKQLCLRTN